MRSAVCTAVFLLLDCLRASAGMREPLVLAAASTGFPKLFQQVLHMSWLGPGLIVALLLGLLALATQPADKTKNDKAKKTLELRRIRAPRLERYRGTLPKRHRDLEL